MLNMYYIIRVALFRLLIKQIFTINKEKKITLSIKYIEEKQIN